MLVATCFILANVGCALLIARWTGRVKGSSIATTNAAKDVQSPTKQPSPEEADSKASAIDRTTMPSVEEKESEEAVGAREGISLSKARVEDPRDDELNGLREEDLKDLREEELKQPYDWLIPLRIRFTDSAPYWEIINLIQKGSFAFCSRALLSTPPVRSLVLSLLLWPGMAAHASIMPYHPLQHELREAKHSRSSGKGHSTQQEQRQDENGSSKPCGHKLNLNVVVVCSQAVLAFCYSLELYSQAQPLRKGALVLVYLLVGLISGG